MAALECLHLSCDRGGGHPVRLSAVKDVSAEFEAGVLHGFHGPDGCGKGLLLNLLGLLEKPQSGHVRMRGGFDASAASDEEIARVRNTGFGFLFTHPYLLPAFSVAENVAMPLFRFRGTELSSARERTQRALDFAGISHIGESLAERLDPTDRWRAAFARALAHEPEILIAISPRCEDILVPLANRAARELGLCVLWAGERDILARHSRRLIEIENGRVIRDTLQ